jgi:predicted dehydrogenase
MLGPEANQGDSGERLEAQSMVKHDVSRRDFVMRASSAAGASLAAKTILLDPVASYAQNTPVAANDRLRMGMIGVGEQGAGVLRRAVAHPGIECVAACDLWDGRHTLAQEIVGKPIKCTRHYQELLDDKDIDIIINATPDHWHSKIVVDSCNAGKDIYSEKPMSHDVAEGFAMVAAAEKHKRIVEIGSGAADSWTSMKAKDLIASGAIGDVHTIEVSTGRNTPNGAWASWMPPPGLSPDNLDWNTWLGNAPKIPFDPIRFARWRGYRAYGTGVAGDLMVHLLTALINSAGFKEPPLRAHSTGGLYVFKDGREYPDVHHVIFDYPNVQVIVKLILTCETQESARYYGTRGLLEIGGNGITITPQDGKDHDPGWYQSGYPKAMRDAYEKQWHLDHDADAPKKRPEPVVYRNAEPGRELDHMGIFFEAVRTRNPKIVTEDAAFGNNAAIACHMANASYFSKSVAVWDAKANRIRTA